MNRMPPNRVPPMPRGYSTPANVLMGLIRQSENRYLTYRSLLQKQDEGFGQLKIDAQNLSVALARDPQALAMLEDRMRAALNAAEINKSRLEASCDAELHLQGELKRWLMGQPPTGFSPGYPVGPGGSFRQPYALPPGQGQGPGQHVFGPVPEGWWPPAQGQMQGPQQPQQSQSPQQVQPPQPPPPQYRPDPSGAPPLVDLSDPKAAADFMKRAQQMPTGTNPSIPAGQPVYNGGQPAYMGPTQPGQTQVPTQVQQTPPVNPPQPSPNGVPAPKAS